MGGVRAGLEGQVASTLRWGLGHALPRWPIRGSARRGDLHGRLIEATASSDAAPLDLFDEVRADGVQLADAWPIADLHSTDGLGHQRILRDPDVIAEVVDFVGR